MRVPATRGRGAQIRVSWPDGDYIGTWSWIKSIDGYTKRRNVLQAMREASRQGASRQIDKDKCVACGATSNLTIDHKSITFIAIAESYMKKNNPAIEHDRSGGWRLEDPQAVIDFHDAKADYQVLCVSCNSSKGRKHSP